MKYQIQESGWRYKKGDFKKDASIRHGRWVNVLRLVKGDKPKSHSHVIYAHTEAGRAESLKCGRELMEYWDSLLEE